MYGDVLPGTFLTYISLTTAPTTSAQVHVRDTSPARLKAIGVTVLPEEDAPGAWSGTARSPPLVAFVS